MPEDTSFISGKPVVDDGGNYPQGQELEEKSADVLPDSHYDRLQEERRIKGQGEYKHTGEPDEEGAYDADYYTGEEKVGDVGDEGTEMQELDTSHRGGAQPEDEGMNDFFDNMNKGKLLVKKDFLMILMLIQVK